MKPRWKQAKCEFIYAPVYLILILKKLKKSYIRIISCFVVFSNFRETRFREIHQWKQFAVSLQKDRSFVFVTRVLACEPAAGIARGPSSRAINADVSIRGHVVCASLLTWYVIRGSWKKGVEVSITDSDWRHGKPRRKNFWEVCVCFRLWDSSKMLPVRVVQLRWILDTFLQQAGIKCEFYSVKFPHWTALAALFVHSLKLTAPA